MKINIKCTKTNVATQIIELTQGPHIDTFYVFVVLVTILSMFVLVSYLFMNILELNG